MPLVQSSCVFALTVLSASTVLIAQTWWPGQTRDASSAPGYSRTPVGTSTISGTVVVADSGRPVRGAGVELNGELAPNAANGFQSSVSRTVLSDASGQFTFPQLPAGRFTISVTHHKLLDANYGQRRPGGRGSIIQLADGQHISLTVPLTRGAVITGMVVSPDGEPLDRVDVHVSRYVMTEGFRRLEHVRDACTDDRGMYRIFGLEPGDYLVNAAPGPDDRLEVALPMPDRHLRPRFYLPTYAPDSNLPSGATVVTVTGGEERTGVDIHLRLTHASTVRGVVLTTLDPTVTVALWLVPDDVTVDAPDPDSARLNADATFTFYNVAPGGYTLVATTVAKPSWMSVSQGQIVASQPPQLSDGQKLWGRVQVNVPGDSVVDTSITLQPTRSISGVVTFDMAHPPNLAEARLTVTVTPAASRHSTYAESQPHAFVGSDGRFVISGVAPGRFALRVNGTGWLKSSIVSGQDTLDFPIEFSADRDVTGAVLTVTGSISELCGVLMDSAGKPAPDYTIVVMSSDRRYWTPGSRRILVTEPGRDGRYAMRSLPQGSYLMAVVADIEDGVQYDPEFLRRLAGAAVPLTITEGAKVVQNLRVK